MQYLVLVPVLLTALGAITVALIARFRPQFRSTWLIVVGVAFVNYGFILALRWILPPAFTATGWLPFAETTGNNLSFQVDSVSWPYLISLSALLLGMILTASARLVPDMKPWRWAGGLAIISMGLLSVTSSSPLAMVLTWTAIDVVELVIVLSLVTSENLSRQTVIAFSVRVLGTLILTATMIISIGADSPLTFESISPSASLLLLLAAGLRLGVLPFHVPYSQELPIRRGLGTLLRLVSPAASLSLLARLPAEAANASWSPFLLGFSILAALFGAAMWLAAENELAGRPYWLVALAGLALSCAIQGQPSNSIPWGVTLLLAGGLLFLFSARSRRMLFIPAAAVLAMTGLPFTPTAAGMEGLVAVGFHAYDLLFLLASGLLMAGFLRHAAQPGDSIVTLDRWVQSIYPVGLFVLPINMWLIAIFGPRGSLVVGPWWAGLISVFIAVVITFSLHRAIRQVEGLTQSWLGALASRVGRFMAAVLRLDWLYRLLWSFYQGLKAFVQAVTQILEGEGGVLWALVLLALLMSLLATGGQP